MKIKIDPLDKLLRRYIRLRDKVCQECGRSDRKLETAHCFGRARKSVRYDEENVCILCFTCHQWYDHHDTEKQEFFRKRLGEEKFDLLQARMRTPARYLDKEAIRFYLEKQISIEEGE